jgi:hypothetical protein
MRTSLIVLLALVLAPAASAAGPWLGTAPSGLGAFTAAVHGTATTVGNGSSSVSVPGKWGLPRVTLNGAVGGLSANGHVLVLAESFEPTGELRPSSSFTVLTANPLAVRTTVRLRGDFGFDALSPDGRTLYLIQHVSSQSLFRYRVRAYDLAADRLLAHSIADKRQRGWDMSGYPIARAASRDGRWVYTLYSNAGGYPFVHALDGVNRTAVCVGIPWNWRTDQEAIDNAVLHVDGRILAIGSRFVLDRTTFKVRRL